MPTLRGTLDVFGKDPPEPCRWCGEPTYTRLAPADARLELEREPIPLHPDCAAELIYLFHDLAAGRPIPPEVRDRLRLLAPGVDGGA